MKSVLFLVLAVASAPLTIRAADRPPELPAPAKLQGEFSGGEEINRLFVSSFGDLAVGATRSKSAAQFVSDVVSYDPGTGTSPRFQNPFAALGAPSQINPFGEETDPFNPPYGTNQIVSIGEGGWLVLGFRTPILNHPNNPHGYDFILFGNSGFIITNDFDTTIFNWVGTPATDGSLFAANPGETRVSVSRDGVNFFMLNPAIAPVVDGPFPTDPAGDPHQPTLPGLALTDFAGATLEDMRTLYNGSAGGTPYDIGWAIDSQGAAVFLAEVNFVRIDVLSGKSELDAVASVSRTPRGVGAPGR